MGRLPGVVPRAAPAASELHVPLVEQAVYVFERMFQWRLEPSPPYVKQSAPPTFDVSATTRLSGQVRGVVALSLPRGTACRATSLLLERPCSYLNDDVADAVRELTNTIVGRAAGSFACGQARFSLPAAIVGRTRPLEWPRGFTPLVIELHSAAESVALECGLAGEFHDALGAPLAASSVLF